MSIRAIGPVTGLERDGSRRMRRRLLPFSAVSVPVSDRPRTADRWQETSRPACRPRDRGTAAAGPVCSGPGRPPLLCCALQAFPRASACRRPAPCDVSSSPRCPHCSSAPAGNQRRSSRWSGARASACIVHTRGHSARRSSMCYTGTRIDSCAAEVKNVRRYQSTTPTAVSAVAPASMNITTIW